MYMAEWPVDLDENLKKNHKYTNGTFTDDLS